MRRLALLLAVVLLASCSRAGSEPRWMRHFDPEFVARFDGFPLYWAGPEVAGHRLTTMGVIRGTGSFLYGRCETGFDLFEYFIEAGGCVPPIAIQIWRRRPLEHDVEACTRLRGVPAAIYGSRIMLFTENVTLVISGESRRLVVKGLRGFNNGVGVAEDLPPPDGNRRLPIPCR